MGEERVEERVGKKQGEMQRGKGQGIGEGKHVYIERQAKGWAKRVEGAKVERARGGCRQRVPMFVHSHSPW